MRNLFLAEERRRLGLKAKEVADFVGIAIPTQSNYELGKRFPDAQYFFKIADLGFDINYVVTGKRNNVDLTNKEELLLELFRKADDSVQNHILSGLLNNEDFQTDQKRNKVKVGSGNRGNVAGGDLKVGR